MQKPSALPATTLDSLLFQTSAAESGSKRKRAAASCATNGTTVKFTAYQQERYHYLHELRQLRASYRVHGVRRLNERKSIQRDMCRIRKAR